MRACELCGIEKSGSRFNVRRYDRSAVFCWAGLFFCVFCVECRVVLDDVCALPSYTVNARLGSARCVVFVLLSALSAANRARRPHARTGRIFASAARLACVRGVCRAAKCVN